MIPYKDRKYRLILLSSYFQVSLQRVSIEHSSQQMPGVNPKRAMAGWAAGAAPLARDSVAQSMVLGRPILYTTTTQRGVVYRGFCLNSGIVAVSNVTSRRWWCIESLFPGPELTGISP